MSGQHENDPTNVAWVYEMPEDLRWLALNTGPKQFGQMSVKKNPDMHKGYQWSDLRRSGEGWYFHTEVEAARQKLQDEVQALTESEYYEDSAISDPDEEECLNLAHARLNGESEKKSSGFTAADISFNDFYGSEKQLRYLDAKGDDWIDEFARTSTVDEFRGAMKFTIGKYLRRAGKKDSLQSEIDKIRDYCGRWLEYEEGLDQ